MPQLYALAPVEFNSAAPTCDCVAHRFGNAADHPERVRRYPSDMTDVDHVRVLRIRGDLRVRGAAAVRSQHCVDPPAGGSHMRVWSSTRVPPAAFSVWVCASPEGQYVLFTVLLLALVCRSYWPRGVYV